MSLPQVAIVGRPNVGKSSLFNWLAGRRLAIVDDVAGVTRDRMTYLLEEEGRYFEIVDTGGIGINDVDELDEEIEQQINFGIEQADMLLFMVDAQDGRTTLDDEIAKRLRSVGKPTLLVANKCDNSRLEQAAVDFNRLGYGTPIIVSAKARRNRDELVDAILETLPEGEIDESEIREPEMKVAIVGRRNVGKSTFINTMLQSDRMIVSEVAGTTRDSVDVRFEMDGKTFLAIDTPGLRRGKSVRTDIDFYGTHRAQRSIRRADVVLMFFDASSRISKVDRQLCNYIADEHKPCILVVNKWDLMAEHMATERWSDYLRDNFPSLWNVPIAFITGASGRNCRKLLNHTQMLFKQSLSRVSTGELNRLIKKALQHQPPPVSKRRRPKIYYATQIGVQPPTFVLFCNDPDSFPPTYRRYLKSVLHDQLEFGEVPLRLFIQEKGQKDKSSVPVSREELIEDFDED